MSHKAPTQSKKTWIDLQTTVDQGGKLVMVTAYDATMAHIADAAGADIILVGDSVGNACLGFENTLPVTMEMMRHHLEAVVRARPNAYLMADLPFLSYHLSVEDALKNAGLLVRAGAQAVKLEGGGANKIQIVRALIDAGIPVMGHLGLTPQSFHSIGGYKVQAKEEAQAIRLLEEAEQLENAGCFSVLLECIPKELAAFVTEVLNIFTIGIGAGPDCSGQVLVFHDILGLNPGPYPKFVKNYMDGFNKMVIALSQWSSDVKNDLFPGEQESYKLSDVVFEKLAARLSGASQLVSKSKSTMSKRKHSK
ncbi:MAG: 3-methyl-2-oxobutanoate hydroxymethyltransferase [Holophagales bacterium]|jgi:3-methyl-2-oxobutanoate hydroxymethyltransferase|nr:3-methyl-2-oxobutanoate hydroxymethyltransferase [Holophagales bacterium]